MEEAGENGDRSAHVKVDFRISDAYSADLLMDSLSGGSFPPDQLDKFHAMASDIEIFLKTFMAYKTNSMNDIQLSALRVLSPEEYEAVRNSLLREGVYDLALQGIDRKELREQGQGTKLSKVATALGIHRFFVTGETGLVGDGLGTNNSLAPREIRFLKRNTPYITARDYAEQWAWVLRVLALDGYVSRRKIPDKNTWFDSSGNTVVLGLHGWSGSGEVVKDEVLSRLAQIKREKDFWRGKADHDALCLIGWSMGGEAVVHLGRKLSSQRLEVLCNKAGVNGLEDLPEDLWAEENLKKRIAVISLMRAAANSCGFLHLTPAEAERKQNITDAMKEITKVLASRATVDIGQIAHNLRLTETELLQFVATIYAGLIMNKSDPKVREIAKEHARVFAREPESVALQKIGLIKYEGLKEQELQDLKLALKSGFLYMLDVWDKDDFLTRMADQEKNAIREGLDVPHFVMHNGYGHAICDPAMRELPVSAVCVWPRILLENLNRGTREIFALLDEYSMLERYVGLTSELNRKIGDCILESMKKLPSFTNVNHDYLRGMLINQYRFYITQRVRFY